MSGNDKSGGWLGGWWGNSSSDQEQPQQSPTTQNSISNNLHMAAKLPHKDIASEFRAAQSANASKTTPSDLSDTDSSHYTDRDAYSYKPIKNTQSGTKTTLNSLELQELGLDTFDYDHEDTSTKLGLEALISNTKRFKDDTSRAEQYAKQYANLDKSSQKHLTPEQEQELERRKKEYLSRVDADLAEADRRAKKNSLTGKTLNMLAQDKQAMMLDKLEDQDDDIVGFMDALTETRDPARAYRMIEKGKRGIQAQQLSPQNKNKHKRKDDDSDYDNGYYDSPSTRRNTSDSSHNNPIYDDDYDDIDYSQRSRRSSRPRRDHDYDDNYNAHQSHHDTSRRQNNYNYEYDDRRTRDNSRRESSRSNYDDYDDYYTYSDRRRHRNPTWGHKNDNGNDYYDDHERRRSNTSRTSRSRDQENANLPVDIRAIRKQRGEYIAAADDDDKDEQQHKADQKALRNFTEALQKGGAGANLDIAFKTIDAAGYDSTNPKDLSRFLQDFDKSLHDPRIDAKIEDSKRELDVIKAKYSGKELEKKIAEHRERWNGLLDSPFLTQLEQTQQKLLQEHPELLQPRGSGDDEKNDQNQQKNKDPINILSQYGINESISLERQQQQLDVLRAAVGEQNNVHDLLADEALSPSIRLQLQHALETQSAANRSLIDDDEFRVLHKQNQEELRKLLENPDPDQYLSENPDILETMLPQSTLNQLAALQGKSLHPTQRSYKTTRELYEAFEDSNEDEQFYQELGKIRELLTEAPDSTEEEQLYGVDAYHASSKYRPLSTTMRDNDFLLADPFGTKNKNNNDTQKGPQRAHDLFGVTPGSDSSPMYIDNNNSHKLPSHESPSSKAYKNEKKTEKTTEDYYNPSTGKYDYVAMRRDKDDGIAMRRARDEEAGKMVRLGNAIRQGESLPPALDPFYVQQGSNPQQKTRTPNLQPPVPRIPPAPPQKRSKNTRKNVTGDSNDDNNDNENDYDYYDHARRYTQEKSKQHPQKSRHRGGDAKSRRYDDIEDDFDLEDLINVVEDEELKSPEQITFEAQRQLLEEKLVNLQKVENENIRNQREKAYYAQLNALIDENAKRTQIPPKQRKMVKVKKSIGIDIFADEDMYEWVDVDDGIDKSKNNHKISKNEYESDVDVDVDEENSFYEQRKRRRNSRRYHEYERSSNRDPYLGDYLDYYEDGSNDSDHYDEHGFIKRGNVTTEISPAPKETLEERLAREEQVDPLVHLRNIDEQVKLLQIRETLEEESDKWMINQSKLDNEKTHVQLQDELSRNTLVDKYHYDRNLEKKKKHALANKFDEKITELKKLKKQEIVVQMRDPKSDVKNLTAEQIEARIEDAVKGLDLSILTDKDIEEVDDAVLTRVKLPKEVEARRDAARHALDNIHTELDEIKKEAKKDPNPFSFITSLFTKGEELSAEDKAKLSKRANLTPDDEAFYRDQVKTTSYENIVYSLLYVDSHTYFDISEDFVDRYRWILRQLRLNHVPKVDLNVQTIRRYNRAFLADLQQQGKRNTPRLLRQKFRAWFDIPMEFRKEAYFTPIKDDTVVTPVRLEVDYVDKDGSKKKRATQVEHISASAPIPKFRHSRARPRPPHGYKSIVQHFDFLVDSEERTTKQKHIARLRALHKNDPFIVAYPYRFYNYKRVPCNERYYRTALLGTVIPDVTDVKSVPDHVFYDANIMDEEYEQYDTQGRLLTFVHADQHHDPNNFFNPKNGGDGGLTDAQIAEIFGDVDPMTLSEEELDNFIADFVEKEVMLSELSVLHDGDSENGDLGSLAREMERHNRRDADLVKAIREEKLLGFSDGELDMDELTNTLEATIDRNARRREKQLQSLEYEREQTKNKPSFKYNKDRV